MTRASDDGWEDSSGSVISGKSGFAHSGSIVYDKSSNILITHVEICVWFKEATRKLYDQAC
jgi:hypothetical protein